MDHNERIKGEMNERLQEDLKARREAQTQTGPQLGPYEQLKQMYPGEEVYAVAVLLACPAPACDAVYPVGMFATKDMGEQFHVPCRKCRDSFVTLRDTIKIFGKNTYPIEMVQKAMREQSGLYTRWMNILKDAYAAAEAAGKKVWEQGRHREHVIHEGGGSKRPVKLRMTAQTTEEAVREMKPTMFSTRKHDPMQETTVEDVAEFFADDNVAGKFGG